MFGRFVRICVRVEAGVFGRLRARSAEQVLEQQSRRADVARGRSLDEAPRDSLEVAIGDRRFERGARFGLRPWSAATHCSPVARTESAALVAVAIARGTPFVTVRNGERVRLRLIRLRLIHAGKVAADSAL